MKLLQRNAQSYSLPSALILTVLMYGFVDFFVLSFSTGVEVLPSVLYSVFLLTVFFLIFYTGRVSLYRRFFFVAIALLFFPSFIANLIESRGAMTFSDSTIFTNDIPFCHMVTPMVLIPFALTKTIIFPGRLEGFASIPMMLVFVAIAAVTIGRGWCSWVCFYGGWDDGISRLTRKVRLSTDGKEEKYRIFSRAMLAFVVLASLVQFSVVYCMWLCPFKLITEYEDPSTFQGFLAFILLVVTFGVLVVLLPFFTRKRIQCGAFCPFGAFQSIIGIASPFRIRIDRHSCVDCGTCIKICPVFALSDESVRKGKTHSNCTLCGECIAACPKKAIGYGFSIGKFSCAGQAGLSGKGAGTVRVLPDKALSLSKRIVQELLAPKTFFIVGAFTFGMVISGGFATSTLTRFVNLITAGSFSLP